jgi:hypothetical protein
MTMEKTFDLWRQKLAGELNKNDRCKEGGISPVAIEKQLFEYAEGDRWPAKVP